MRGVILAGGTGSRLGELTKVTNKHLLPVGTEPMIYHPIKKLVGAGVTDILIVTGPEHAGDFLRLLGSGRKLGCTLTYRVQDEAGGIAQALALAEDFCGGKRCAVLLGDNIFQSNLHSFVSMQALQYRAVILLKKVPEPQRFGVAEVVKGEVVSIEEKPSAPRSDLAVVGVYSYPADVFDVIRTLKPSKRGELEITDVNNYFLKGGRLRSKELEGYWTDAGTPDSLRVANAVVHITPPEF